MSMSYIPLEQFLTEYRERNTDNKYRPVAVGRYGIRTRESIYSKELAKDYSKNKVIFKDTLTIGMGAKQIDIGILSTDDIYSVSPAYHTFQIHGINSEYLRYCLECRNEDMSVRYMVASVRQGKSVDIKHWIKYEIPVYDSQKQLEIIGELDMVSEAIDSANKILTILDRLVKSRFIEMFGDPIANPKEWDLFPLLELGDCKNGMNFHKGEAGTEIKYLGVGDFQDKAIINIAEELDSISLNEMPKSEYLLRDGDIVFVRSNGSKELVGRCLVIYPGDIPTTYSGFCIRWRKKTDLIMPVYLVYTLKCESVRQKTVGRGANIQNLNQQILGQLNIPVPPLWLQQNFATFVQEIDKSKYEHENSKLFSLFITIFMISYIILRDISEYIFWNETKYFIWRVFQCQRYLCFLELLCECKVKKVENITNRIFTLYMGMMKL